MGTLAKNLQAQESLPPDAYENHLIQFCIDSNIQFWKVHDSYTFLDTEDGDKVLAEMERFKKKNNGRIL